MGRKTRVGIIAAGIIVLASTVTSYYFVSSHYANRQKADSTESGQIYGQNDERFNDTYTENESVKSSSDDYTVKKSTKLP
jgi:hypothetical protein